MLGRTLLKNHNFSFSQEEHFISHNKILIKITLFIGIRGKTVGKFTFFYFIQLEDRARRIAEEKYYKRIGKGRERKTQNENVTLYATVTVLFFLNMENLLRNILSIDHKNSEFDPVLILKGGILKCISF